MTPKYQNQAGCVVCMLARYLINDYPSMNRYIYIYLYKLLRLLLQLLLLVLLLLLLMLLSHYYHMTRLYHLLFIRSFIDIRYHIIYHIIIYRQILYNYYNLIDSIKVLEFEVINGFDYYLGLVSIIYHIIYHIIIVSQSILMLYNYYYLSITDMFNYHYDQIDKCMTITMTRCKTNQ